MEEYHTLSKATHQIYHYANRTMRYAQIHYFHYFQNNLSQSTIKCVRLSLNTNLQISKSFKTSILLYFNVGYVRFGLSLDNIIKKMHWMTQDVVF